MPKYSEAPHVRRVTATSSQSTHQIFRHGGFSATHGGTLHGAFHGAFVNVSGASFKGNCRLASTDVGTVYSITACVVVHFYRLSGDLNGIAVSRASTLSNTGRFVLFPQRVLLLDDDRVKVFR